MIVRQHCHIGAAGAYLIWNIVYAVQDLSGAMNELVFVLTGTSFSSAF